MSVRRKWRVERSISRTPSRFSRLPTWRLKVDLGRPSARAAAEKPLFSTTAAKKLMSFRSCTAHLSRGPCRFKTASMNCLEQGDGGGGKTQNRGQHLRPGMKRRLAILPFPAGEGARLLAREHVIAAPVIGVG